MKFAFFQLFFLFFSFVICGQNVLPKNIILMIGDGMGFEQLQASLYYQGKTEQNVWQNFPVNIAASTYNAGIDYNPALAWTNKDYVLQEATESDAAATAIATGQRRTEKRLGISVNDIPMTNPVQISGLIGKSSGVVTSVPFNHATPAGFVAHNISRYNYGEIAKQMILHSNATVIMGCGHPWYDNNGKRTDTASYRYVYSKELWENLKSGSTIYNLDQKYTVQDIDADGIADPWQYSDDSETLIKIINGNQIPKRLFFLAPVYQALLQVRSGNSEKPWLDPVSPNIPSLINMSLAALKILSQNENGFFLMIEGGAIDWAGHDNNLTRLIEEQMEFEKTADAVINWVNENSSWNETLLIVMADHECGYLTGGFDDQTGFRHIADNGHGNLPEVEFFSTDHTNHLVPFFAKGSMSHTFDFLAHEFDPVRGRYLHISDVGKTIRYFWGKHAFAFPPQIVSASGNHISVTATSPFDLCSYRWYLNNEPVPGMHSPVFEMSLTHSSEVFCEITCHNKVYKTNIVSVIIE